VIHVVLLTIIIINEIAIVHCAVLNLLMTSFITNYEAESKCLATSCLIVRQTSSIMANSQIYNKMVFSHYNSTHAHDIYNIT
jgi:hypothetical protein